ncbi:hypothetical protein JCM8097_005160 [Rhodosporidiobolus ruineniae]
MFRRLHTLGLLVLTLTTTAGALWPRPRSYSTGNGTLRLASTFEVAFADSLAGAAPLDLKQAVERTASVLISDRFQRLVPDRGEWDRPAVEEADELCVLKLALTSSLVKVLSITDEVRKPFEQRDEAYSLNTGENDGAASLSANSTLGLLRGLQTFEQLVYTLPGDEHVRYIPSTPVEIEDSPAFPYRGFMLDTSRNFFPVEDILRTLDAMASVKLSTFHWHATDSQSWPLFVPAFPNLTAAAYSAAEVYSWEDVQTVQEYAGVRGIDVMLEVDMPGHTASIAKSFPDYVACLESTPWATYSAEPPAGQLRLGDEATLQFSKQVVKSVTSMLSSRYFSTGGDEVNEQCYRDDPITGTALNRSSFDGLLSTFVNSLHDTVRDSGKTPLVWEEMVLNHDLELANDTIVLTWTSSNSTSRVADQGFRIIHSPSDYVYLDCGSGPWVGNNVGGRSWCDPFKSWQKVYSFDPLANLTASQYKLVLGGQSLLWSEQTSPENLDSQAWPRAAAAAEVFWTGGSLEGGSRCVAEALPRLHDWRYRAVGRGIKAAALQPHCCALRPHLCDLGA